MSLYLLVCYKGPTRDLLISGLVSDKSVADEFIKTQCKGVDLPHYFEVLPDMFFYQVKIEMSEGPDFTTFLQTPVTFSLDEIRIEAEKQAPDLIKRFVEKSGMVGYWKADTFRVIDVRFGY